MPITTGTKTALILSANCCIGGFSDCACFTKLKILLSTVSLPIAVTCAFTVPSVTRLPPISLSFFCFDTGLLSPVSKDSFTCILPHSILQSMGTCSPVFIKIRSPTCSWVFSTGKMSSLCSSSKAIIFAITFC